MSKKLIALLLTALLVTGLVAGCGGGSTNNGDAKEPVKEKESEQVFVTIATGGTAGTYFPLGELWQKYGLIM